ncbi:MAG: hypothetical protein IPM95_16095 [Sphingobacteriales bacterium]|nr:hypothetical protein [Sphingobacteriales bacterium]
MKTVNQIRSMAAIAAVIFTATLSGCKKTEVAPVTPPPVNNTPPPVVVQPSVNTKPRFITTTENGSTIKSQAYEYDSQGRLIRFFSKNTTSVDTVIINFNVVLFKSERNSGVSIQKLFLNGDKTMKNLFTSNIEVQFENNQNKISRLAQSVDNGPFNNIAGLDYTNNNLSSITAEAVLSFNYYNDLPYQKGINEPPTAFKPFQYYKVLEQEGATTSVLYNKLLKQSVLNAGIRREQHDYIYTFDSDNRVTKISETITITIGSSSTQKIHENIIAY